MSEERRGPHVLYIYELVVANMHTGTFILYVHTCILNPHSSTICLNLYYVTGPIILGADITSCWEAM